MRSTAAGLILFSLIFSFGCKKDREKDESGLLHGTWVKGANFGDTLWFMKKNGKHILRMTESFNPALPIYSEKEYRFANGELNIRSFAPVSQDYFPITSFSWTNRGQEFTIINSQLFMFMSSIVTYKYKKI